MFENLKPVAIDPILGLMVAFKADNRAEKIDLGVGVYQDDRGRTPVMASVKEAESRLMELEAVSSTALCLLWAFKQYGTLGVPCESPDSFFC